MMPRAVLKPPVARVPASDVLAVAEDEVVRSQDDPLRDQSRFLVGLEP